MEKEKKETPMLPSDLLPPGSNFDDFDAGESVIPILSWIKGSPFDPNRPLSSQSRKLNESLNSMTSEWGDLHKYFPKPPDAPPDDEDEEGDNTFESDREESDDDEGGDGDYADDVEDEIGETLPQFSPKKKKASRMLSPTTAAEVEDESLTSPNKMSFIFGNDQAEVEDDDDLDDYILGSDDGDDGNDGDNNVDDNDDGNAGDNADDRQFTAPGSQSRSQTSSRKGKGNTEETSVRRKASVRVESRLGSRDGSAQEKAKVSATSSNRSSRRNTAGSAKIRAVDKEAAEVDEEREIIEGEDDVNKSLEEGSSYYLHDRDLGTGTGEAKELRELSFDKKGHAHDDDERAAAEYSLQFDDEKDVSFIQDEDHEDYSHSHTKGSKGSRVILLDEAEEGSDSNDSDSDIKRVKISQRKGTPKKANPKKQQTLSSPAKASSSSARKGTPAAVGGGSGIKSARQHVDDEEEEEGNDDGDDDQEDDDDVGDDDQEDEEEEEDEEIDYEDEFEYSAAEGNSPQKKKNLSTATATDAEKQQQKDKEEQEQLLEGTLASYMGLLERSQDGRNILNDSAIDAYADEILKSAGGGGDGEEEEVDGYEGGEFSEDLKDIMSDYRNVMAMMSAGGAAGGGGGHGFSPVKTTKSMATSPAAADPRLQRLASRERIAVAVEKALKSTGAEENAFRGARENHRSGGGGGSKSKTTAQKSNHNNDSKSNSKAAAAVQLRHKNSDSDEEDGDGDDGQDADAWNLLGLDNAAADSDDDDIYPSFNPQKVKAPAVKKATAAAGAQAVTGKQGNSVVVVNKAERQQQKQQQHRKSSGRESDREQPQPQQQQQQQRRRSGRDRSSIEREDQDPDSHTGGATADYSSSAERGDHQQQQPRKNKEKKNTGKDKEKEKRRRRQSLVGEEDPAKEAAARAAVKERHLSMLAEMAARRKQEELEAQEAAERAIAKRKKFKEALLEKALRARAAAAGGESQSESDLPAAATATQAPVAAAKLAKQPSTRVTNNVDVVKGGDSGKKLPQNIKMASDMVDDDEEVQRLEQEKREKIAAIRRKFKEQHKKILLSLVCKNEEEKKKVEEQLQQEEIARKNHKLKAIKLAAKRAEALANAEAANRLQEAAAPATDATRGTSNAAAAAVAAAAREQRRHVDRYNKHAATGNEEVAAEEQEEEEDGEDGNNNEDGVGGDDGDREEDEDEDRKNKQQQQQDAVHAAKVKAGKVRSSSIAVTSSSSAAEKTRRSSAAAGSALAIVRASRSQGAGETKGGGLDGSRDHILNKEVSSASKAVGRSDGRRPRRGEAGGPAVVKVEKQDLSQPLTEEEEKARKERQAAAKLYQARVAAYLIALAEQKKKEEDETKAKEIRAKRRVALLSQRLQNEAAEKRSNNAGGVGIGGGEASARSDGDDDSNNEDDDAEKKKKAGERKRSALRNKSTDSAAGDNGSGSSSAKGSSGGPAGAHDKETKEKKDRSSSVATKAEQAIKEQRDRGKENIVKPPLAPSNRQRPPAAAAAASSTDDTTNASASTKPTKKITSEVADAIAQRLSKHTKSDDGTAAMSVPVRDFADWKRKNAVPQDAKVFAMTGWYPCVKQALLDRGWHFNPDPESPYFDLKWTLRSIDVSQEVLHPWQLTNHFLKNVAITTKVGLIRSLQSLVWMADVSANDVIPRGYDLSNGQEMQAFIDDFRCQKAESILKVLYKKATGLKEPEADVLLKEGVEHEADEWQIASTPRPITAASSSKSKQASSSSSSSSSSSTVPADQQLMINSAVFETCCSVLEKYLRPSDDKFLDDEPSSPRRPALSPRASGPGGQFNGPTIGNTEASEIEEVPVVTALEWELLSSCDLYKSGNLAMNAPEPIDGFLKDRDDDNPKQAGRMHREKKKKNRDDQAARERASSSVHSLVQFTPEALHRVHTLLCKLRAKDRSQSGLNGKGDHAKNMWIVKPAAKSRGRGITTFADLPKLLKYVEAGSGSGKSCQWIVQKYMENPLTIAKRKFDMRQWVLVTDWNPLTIYFYDECYARFSAEEYDNSDSSLENSYIHLVNNSIVKNSDHFHRIVVAEDGQEIEDCMWSFESLQKFLISQTGKDVLCEKIHPRMKEIAKWSLMSAVDAIEHRKNSWELYGFDFMVDDDYNAWLIEINSSPACDYSTKVTEKYVQAALVNLLSVTLDMREWESTPKNSRGEKPDTGGWECIYKGPLYDVPKTSFGTDMTLKGEAMKAPRRALPAVATFGNSASTVTSSNGQYSPSRNGGKGVSSLTVSGSSQAQAPPPGRQQGSKPTAAASAATRAPLSVHKTTIGGGHTGSQRPVGGPNQSIDDSEDNDDDDDDDDSDGDDGRKQPAKKAAAPKAVSVASSTTRTSTGVQRTAPASPRANNKNTSFPSSPKAAASSSSSSASAESPYAPRPPVGGAPLGPAGGAPAPARRSVELNSGSDDAGDKAPPLSSRGVGVGDKDDAISVALASIRKSHENVHGNEAAADAGAPAGALSTKGSSNKSSTSTPTQRSAAVATASDDMDDSDDDGEGGRGGDDDENPNPRDRNRDINRRVSATLAAAQIPPVARGQGAQQVPQGSSSAIGVSGVSVQHISMPASPRSSKPPGRGAPIRRTGSLAGAAPGGAVLPPGQGPAAAIRIKTLTFDF